jgi:hypothetical protein
MYVHKIHKFTKFNWNLKRLGEKLQFLYSCDKAHICDCFHCVFSHFTKELLNNWGFYSSCIGVYATSQTSMSTMLLLPCYEVVWSMMVSNCIMLIQNFVRIHYVVPPLVTCMQTKLALHVCMLWTPCKEHAQNNYFWVVWCIFVIYNMRIQVF